MVIILFSLVLLLVSFNTAFSDLLNKKCPYGSINRIVKSRIVKSRIVKSYTIDIIKSKYITKKLCIRSLTSLLYNKEVSNPKQLIDDGFLKKEEYKNSEDKINKGFISKIIVRILNLENSHLGYLMFKSDRHAYKICYHYGFFNLQNGTEKQYISSKEFLSVLQRLRKIIFLGM